MPLCFFNHPFLFAAVAIAAIGVVVYELVTEENKRRHGNYRRPSRPSSPDDRRRPSFPDDNQKPPFPDDHRRLLKKPHPDSSQPSGSLSSKGNEMSLNDEAPGNNLRKRNINTRSESPSSDLKNTANFSPTTAVKRSSETPLMSLNSENSPDKKFDEKNYCKNMLDKLTNDTKNVKENIRSERNLGHNIYEEESDSSDDNLFLKAEEKLINEIAADKNASNYKKPYKRKRKSKNAVKKSAQNHSKHNHCFDNHDMYITLSSSDSQSDDFLNISVTSDAKTCPIQQKRVNENVTDQSAKSQTSNIYPALESKLIGSNSSSDEDEYKKEFLEALKNDVKNKKESNSDSSNICSLEKVEKESHPESEFCKACEENHINTRAYPCNHSYLCANCAIKIFRLYKKCNICLENIVEYVQFAP